MHWRAICIRNVKLRTKTGSTKYGVSYGNSKTKVRVRSGIPEKRSWIFGIYIKWRQFPVAARSMEWVWADRLLGLLLESRRGGHRCLPLESVVFCQIGVSATNWSLVQRSPTDCGVSVCDLETSWMRKPWPAVGRSTIEKKIKLNYV